MPFLLGDSERLVANLRQPRHFAVSPSPLGNQHEMQIVPIATARCFRRQPTDQRLGLVTVNGAKTSMIRGSAHDSLRDLVRNICLDILSMVLADRLHGHLPAELHAQSCSGKSVLQASFDAARENNRRNVRFDAKGHQDALLGKARFQEPQPVLLPAFTGAGKWPSISFGNCVPHVGQPAQP